MATNIDDALRSELRRLVELDTTSRSAETVYSEVRRRVTVRRRNRRLAAGVCGAVAIMVVGAALTVRNPESGLTTANEPQVGESPGSDTPSVGSPQLSIRWIEGRGGPDGTEDVAVVFDGQLPDTPATLVDDVTAVEASGIAYAIQTGSSVKVCGNTHYFNESFASVDLFVPAAWLASAEPTEGGVRVLPARSGNPDEGPGKIVVCQPRNGYVQISIWGAASRVPTDIDVRLSDDRRRLLVEARPGGEYATVNDESPTFVPPRTIDGAEAVFPITLLDGTIVEVAVPTDLFESIDSFAAATGVRVDENTVVRADVEVGGAGPLTVGPWSVVLSGDSLNERVSNEVASNLVMGVDRNGYPVLEGLQLGPIDSPDVRLDGPNTSIWVFVRSCTSTADARTTEGYIIGDGGDAANVTLCDPATGLEVWLRSQPAINSAQLDRVTISVENAGPMYERRLQDG